LISKYNEIDYKIAIKVEYSTTFTTN